MKIKISNPQKILRILGLVGVVTVSLTSPFAGTQLVKELVKYYIKKQKFERQRFLQDLERLQDRKLINYQELSDERVEMTITKNGKEKLLIYKLDELQLKKPARWDSLWRLVIFDIPHYRKKARDAFRLKLKDMRFYPLQKSVFITPYPCEDELDFLGTLFKVRDYILILYVSRFEGEEKLRHHFNI